MATSTERIKHIETLTPRQALDIVQFMTAWLDEQRTDSQDFAAEQQIEILNALFQEVGYSPLPLSTAAKPDEQAVGQAARRLLMLLTESDDGALLAELDHRLANPPEAETKALVEVIVVPIVITACIIALGTDFEFELKDGAWRTKGTRKGILGKDLKDVLPGFYGALKSLIGLT
jgi:hypothetical protein